MIEVPEIGSTVMYTPEATRENPKPEAIKCVVMNVTGGEHDRLFKLCEPEKIVDGKRIEGPQYDDARPGEGPGTFVWVRTGQKRRQGQRQPA